ncbi:MAG: hypothetical protein ACMUHU_05470 [Thermoplasmatota archaeon]
MTVASILPSFDAVSEEGAHVPGSLPSDPEAPTRGEGPRTSFLIGPGIEGAISSSDNLSSDNGIAFTFEKNSLELLGSLPAAFQTTQGIFNGRVIAENGPYTFVSHIIEGGGGSWFSFWLSRYDGRIDRWDQSVEVHNVTGYSTAGCEIAIAGGQLFYGIYVTSTTGSESGIYVKQIDLDSWASIVNAVAMRLDVNGHVSKGGRFLTVGSDLLVFWINDDLNECLIASYRNLAWSAPARALPEAVEIMPGTRASKSGVDVYLGYRKGAGDGLNVSVSPNGGISWPANYGQGIIFSGTDIQFSSASYGGILYVLAVDRNNGLGRVYRSLAGWSLEYTGSEFDLGSIDQLDGSFQGHITADRSQVVVAFEGQSMNIQVFASKDQGSTFSSMGTFGNNAWCPAFDEGKNLMAYYQDGRLVLYRFAMESSGWMTTGPISPLGLSSWDDFGFLVDGFGPGSSLEMRVMGGDGTTQLFPSTGYLDILSLDGGSIAGVAYSCAGRFSGAWASGETLADIIILEVRAARSGSEFPAILEIALNHTNGFPFIEPLTRRDHVASITNMTYTPGGITLQDLRSKGEIVIGPLEREGDWCDVVGIATYSNSPKVSFRVGLLNDARRSITGFALKDSITVSQPGQVHYMRWGNLFLKDLPHTIETIYIVIEVGSEEPTARPGVGSVHLEFSQDPTMEGWTMLDPEVPRGGTASLSIDVDDREEPDGMLTVSVEVKDPSTGEWTPKMDRGQSWSSDRWVVLLETSYEDNVGTYEVAVTITDSFGDRRRYELGPALTVVNNIPGKPGIYLLPEVPTTGDELSVEIYREANDLETPTDQLSYNYRIYRGADMFLEVDRTRELSLSVEPGTIREGEDWTVEVTAWDGLNESSPAVSEVKIFNTRPVIMDHPNNITMLEDNVSEAFDHLSWFQDKDLETLDIELSADEEFELIVQNGTLRVRPEEDFNGRGILVVKASDEEGSVRVSIPLIVVAVNDPPVIESVNETSVTQGEWLHMTVRSYDSSDGDNVFVINDIEDQVPGVQPGVNYMIMPNGSFELWATNDMVGSHTITVEASDGIAVVNTTFILNVVNVNDEPRIPGIMIDPDRVSFMENEMITLRGQCDDPDLPWGDMIAYSWMSDLDGPIGSSCEIEVMLTPGSHIITLEVTDSSGLKNTSTVTIEVSRLPEEMGDVMSTSTLLLITAVISFITGCVIAFIIFTLVKKKRSADETPSEPSPGGEEGQEEKKVDEEGDKNALKEGKEGAGEEGEKPSGGKEEGKEGPEGKDDPDRGGETHE